MKSPKTKIKIGVIGCKPVDEAAPISQKTVKTGALDMIMEEKEEQESERSHEALVQSEDQPSKES